MEINELLLKPCSEFTGSIDDAIALSDLLERICRTRNAFGLAANQIGIDSKVFHVITWGTIFNPELELVGDKTEIEEEGCLSFPGLYLKIERHSSIRLKGLVLDKATKQLVPCGSMFMGLTARVMQHEYDHVMGIPFTQRVSKLVLNRALKKRDKKRKGGLGPPDILADSWRETAEYFKAFENQV